MKMKKYEMVKGTQFEDYDDEISTCYGCVFLNEEHKCTIPRLIEFQAGRDCIITDKDKVWAEVKE